MSIYEDTNPKALKQLLNEIDQCEAVLPEFQRDFVWEPSATKELIISILQNYPTGSLLRIQNTQNLFAIRQFEGAAPIPANHKPKFLVLDGQQRLTSLYQAFYGKGNYRYYFQIQKYLNGGDINNCIIYVKKNEAAAYDKVEYQAKELVLPLSQFKGSVANYSAWIQQLVMHIIPTNQIEAFDKMKVLNDFGGDVIQTVDDYAFPVVTLSDKTGVEAVCNIFETLNRTGVKLSPFELLVARFYPHKVLLRKMWDDAVENYPIIQDFDIDPYYVLQIITLAGSKTPTNGRRDVLNMTVSMIERCWDKAIKGLVTALEILRGECGVLNPYVLPYNTIVNPMAAVIANVSLSASPSLTAAMRKQLIRWFWCSVFSQTYESSPTSQSASDVSQLLTWLGGGQEPESVANFSTHYNPTTLRQVTSRQRAVYRGVIALTLSRKPLDFQSGTPLNSDLVLTEKIDAYPVFSATTLKSLGIVNHEQTDTVLNRILVGRDISKVISHKKPSDYLYEIELALNSAGPNFFGKLLDSHLLPVGDNSPLKTNDFDAFLAWRLNAIWLEIQVVTMKKSIISPAVMHFPQIKDITDASLRQNIENAIAKLTEATVHDGLQNLGVMYEGSLKAYLIAAHQKGIFPVSGNSKAPSEMLLNDLMYAYCKLHPNADKPVLLFLKELRNSLSHPGYDSFVPSPEKRQQLMQWQPMVAGQFIDAIKLFNDQRRALL